MTLNPTVDISGETEAIRPIRKIRTDHDRFEPGGGGINVARVIHALDGEAEALFLSGGEIGALLDRLLANRRIHRHRVHVGGQTRIGFTARERSTGLEYRFVQEGPSVHVEDLQPLLDVVAAHQGEYVVCSGSLPHGVPDDVYARMAELAAVRNARFVLDSSGAALRTTLERARVFLVKPSIGELEQLAGRSLDEHGAELAAAELVADGMAEMVAVTLGADGAILATAEGVVRFPAIHRGPARPGRCGWPSAPRLALQQAGVTPVGRYERRELHYGEQVAAIAGLRRVVAEAHVDSGREHLGQPGDPVAELGVGAGVVRDVRAGLAHQPDLMIGEPTQCAATQSGPSRPAS